MASADSRFWITFNGEIYNYRQLRSELDAETNWRSQSDTEVLIKAFETWREACLPKLRGMFAFAIWDDRSRELFLARDAFGIKPLYYYHDKNIFVFASEIRALLSSGVVPRKLSKEGLVSYLSFGSTVAPLTIVDDVKSLRPAHYLKVKLGQDRIEVQQNAYLDPAQWSSVSSITDRREAVTALRDKLKESVRLHLVSDVPVAAFLSGGMDSSAIVALMATVTDKRPKTFTVAFGEKEFAEQQYAHAVSKRYSTEHTDVLLSEGELLSLLPNALEAMDQPTMDGVNTFVISKAVKEAGITVALSGLGSDELFAGYPSFRRVQLLKNLRAVPAPIRTMVARTGQAVFGNSVQQRKTWKLIAAGGDPRSTYQISRMLFGEEEIGELCDCNQMDGLTGGQAHDNTADGDTLNAVSVCELQGYMANTLLRDTDQMSMAFSLEARVPFVDVNIASFVLGLPGSWKVDRGRPKPLLLDALTDLIPEEVWKRPKMGFTLPFDRWLRSSLKHELDDAFSDRSGFHRIGIGDASIDLWNRFTGNGHQERWARPWALYTLKRWCELNSVEL